jgi:hypothetical protein
VIGRPVVYWTAVTKNTLMEILELLKLFGLVVLQNAAFTLVSRARNSDSLTFHALASMVSNTIWLLVIRQVVLNLSDWKFMIVYVVASVIGSISMHYVSMKYFEKKTR